MFTNLLPKHGQHIPLWFLSILASLLVISKPITSHGVTLIQMKMVKDCLMGWEERTTLDLRCQTTWYLHLCKIEYKSYFSDLCFITTDINDMPIPVSRTVLQKFPSQHCPIILENGISFTIIKSAPLPRWNLNKATWELYREITEKK